MPSIAAGAAMLKAAAVGFFGFWRGRGTSMSPVKATLLPLESAQDIVAKTIEVTVTRPALPPGIEGQIIACLQRGEQPDEQWMKGASYGASLVRFQSYRGAFLSVVGETCENPDGMSRQALLQEMKPGQVAWLIVEPANPHDSRAVAVYVEMDAGVTGQIGYLPQNHNMGDDVAAEKVAAWMARIQSRGPGEPLGAIVYVVTATT